MLTTFFWEGWKKKKEETVSLGDLRNWRVRDRCSYFDVQIVEVVTNSRISHAVFVFVYPVGDVAIFHAALANQIVGLNFICLDHLRKCTNTTMLTRFVLVHDNQKVLFLKVLS